MLVSMNWGSFKAGFGGPFKGVWGRFQAGLDLILVGIGLLFP